MSNASAHGHLSEFLSLIAKKSSREYPTLLHIAAKLGLKQFCSTLQKFPGYQAAVCMKNKHNKTPSQIALHAGHTDLASNIQPPENFAIFQDKDVQSNYVTLVMYWFSWFPYYSNNGHPIYIKYIGFIFTSSNDLKYFLKHNVPRFFKTIYDTFINYKDQVISTHVFFKMVILVDTWEWTKLQQVTAYICNLV